MLPPEDIPEPLDMPMTPPRILIAEDSPNIAERIAHNLETQLGFDCVIASTCAEATRIMEAEGPRLFLAILDLVLPDAPQGEVVNVARIRRIPSVVFTSTFNELTRKRILSKDVIDYIIKDANAVDNLVYTVERLYKNRSIKILVVDDSSTVRGYIKHELKRYMFQVYEASCGSTALKIIERNPGIRLVIADYRMPELNGVELTKHLRKTYSRNEMAIIGLSALTDQPLSVQFIKNGANDFISKPFQREELYCRVIQNIESNEQFAELHKLDTLKNKFLAMAAHDLRNPINGIKGLSSLLLSNAIGPLSDEQHEIIGTMEQACEEMLQLVSDLLDVSVMESGRLELHMHPRQLSEVIRKRLPFAELSAAHKGIQISADLPLVPELIIDKDRIAQVTDNLLSNAIKYSPPHSKVTITLSQTAHEVQLCVQDQGPGIPQHEQQELFRSFHKGSVRPTGGESSTGLGLTIVRRIMTAHKGRVWVDSHPNTGSAFYIALPLPPLE